MSFIDNIHLSKPPKFEGKMGTMYVIWDINNNNNNNSTNYTN